jgi:hypothetical protein
MHLEPLVQIVGIALFGFGAIGFAGGLTGEILYASRLLNERRKFSDDPSVLDWPLATLAAGWIAAFRAKRHLPELRDLALHNPVVARDLPRFLVCRRIRQISFVAGAIAVIFLA